MFEYLFLAAPGIILILLYCFVNRPGLIGWIFRMNLNRDSKIERKRSYMEAFNEHKKGKTGITAHVLPYLAVVALFIILTNQYVVVALITTGSMEPTLNRGDLALMQTVDKSAKIGDIVTYGKYGFADPISHRVVNISENGYIITRGDANPVNDEPVSPSRVAGKIVQVGGKPIVFRGLGYFIKPERIGELKVLNKLPPNFVMAQAFNQFRTVTPMILLFGTIFYFMLVYEARQESERRFGRNGKNKPKIQLNDHEK